MLSRVKPEMLIELPMRISLCQAKLFSRIGFLASRFTTFQQRPGVNRAFPGRRAIQVRLSSAEEQHG
jgi:hypothetical protein